ncbi:MAG: 16S rRNA (cytosine(1402)-N(4))-methyltransferase RsmH [Zetaproteobacteria bacterium]|nr:MAG: 16S rRNA (cytosine(1402)-N(4))-methyltransferase RsmH [Zetaproteobacteria bacterium]
MSEHAPVLREAFADFLVVRKSGRYVDATFGRGGHARAVLARLAPEGRLLALDRDPEAVAAAEALAREDSRCVARHAAFSELAFVLDELGWDAVDGVGFDLGVSSPQLDDPARGFSFRQPGPLDMRMDPTRGEPLARKLARVSERRLAEVLRAYGDERYARRIAAAILRAFRRGEIRDTAALAEVVARAVPRTRGRIHPATRTFQALRIWVNDELEELRRGLAAAVERLAPGGRLVVISFHSGEDRIVRDAIEAEVRGCICPPRLPCVCGRKPRMRWVQKKPIRPSEDEVARNPRARSARLRVAERLP